MCLFVLAFLTNAFERQVKHYFVLIKEKRLWFPTALSFPYFFA